jgi:hypothetical protein
MAGTCCVMQAYFKPDTRENRIAWVVFGVAMIFALIMTPLGSSRLNSCAKSYNKCLNGPHTSTSCDQILIDCSALEWCVVSI